MKLPSDSLGLAIQLYSDLVDREPVGERACQGILPDKYNYTDTIESLENMELLVNSSREARVIELKFPSTFFINLDSLLKGASRRMKVPTEFYIADEEFRYSTELEELPKKVKSYLAITSLFQLLEEVSDFNQKLGSDSKLIFIAENKLTLTSMYTIDDLNDLPDLNSFESDFVLSSIHKQQKHTIIKTVLLEFFKGERTISFSNLVGAFPLIFERIVHSYQIYVSEFSFKKVKDEVEKDKLKYVAQINGVLASIQNQILSVPVALVLVASQMEKAPDWKGKNLVIWLGSLVFTIFLVLLIQNQRHTLKAIKGEIDQQWLGIKSNYKAAFGQFEGVYKQLEIRYEHQNTLLNIVMLLSFCAFIGATAALLYFHGLLTESIALVVCAIPIFSLLAVYFFVRWVWITKVN